MESRKLDYVFSNAITDLLIAGFQVKEEAFGFSVVLQDSDTTYRLECGYEHDGNISISIHSGMPPVRWFFRPTIREIVNLLIAANGLLKSGEAYDWLNALERIET